MNYDFLGAGWSFPVDLDPETQGVKRASYEKSIEQAIWLILATAPGERVMRPDFGCGIHDLVFAMNDVTTASRVASAVRRALIEWEPRIDLLEVSAAPDVRWPNCLLIRIGYRVRATNSRFNLVYPFYLE